MDRAPFHNGVAAPVKSIHESEPVANAWGQLLWLVSGVIVPGAEQTLGIVTIQSGKRNPLHLHPNCEELLYVMSGECDHKLGDKMYHLSSGSVICIPRNTPHWAKCTSADPLVAVISFSTPDRQTENLEESEPA